jgi:hypothetical protein
VAEKNQYNSQPELSMVGVGVEGKGGAFSAALKICFKKHELRLHYHQKHIENCIFVANPRNKQILLRYFARHFLF